MTEILRKCDNFFPFGRQDEIFPCSCAVDCGHEYAQRNMLKVSDSELVRLA